MKQYLDLVRNIYENGTDREGRNAVTRSLFALQFRYKFPTPDTFPALTTKKLAFKAVKSELLWFLMGSRDDNDLKKLIGKNRTIWTKNAESDYWKARAEFPGDLGRIYGPQWRSWKTSDGRKIDQIKNVTKSLIEKPYDRRHIVSAWNPGELEEQSLPPCHVLFQFLVDKNKLTLAMTQRSADMFLGAPFNIASYGLLLTMMAQVTGLVPDELVITFNDAHIYHSHFEAVEMQLARKPLALPKFHLKKSIRDIDTFTMDDIKLVNYKHRDVIKAKMIV